MYMIRYDIIINLYRYFINKYILFTVGKPIDVPKIVNPEKEDIEKYHQIFIEELIKLFEEHKTKYSLHPDEMELVLD